MRIAHYQAHLRGPESGTANSGRGWCEALARQGVEVVGLYDGEAVSGSPPEGTQTIPMQHSLRGAMRVPRAVEQFVRGADAVVLHGGWLLGNIVVGRACARVGVPFVVTTHGVYLPEVLQRRALLKRAWASLLERPHLKRAFAIHVFFSEERDQLGYLSVGAPAIVAPNGISYPEGVTWDGGSGGYLLWLGRFDPATKGLDLLVRAIARIPASHRPNVRLHGPDWRDHKRGIKDLVTELGLDGWVTIGDPIYGDEKWELLRRARGCVYPSRWDACPVAVAEAAAVGVPTLVTRYSLGNFLAAEGAAVQTDPDVSSIAEGISRLMSAEATAMSGKASALARRELSWDAVSKSWLEQLQELLDGRKRGARWEPVA